MKRAALASEQHASLKKLNSLSRTVWISLKILVEYQRLTIGGIGSPFLWTMVSQHLEILEHTRQTLDNVNTNDCYLLMTVSGCYLPPECPLLLVPTMYNVKTYLECVHRSTHTSIKKDIRI